MDKYLSPSKALVAFIILLSGLFWVELFGNPFAVFTTMIGVLLFSFYDISATPASRFKEIAIHGSVAVLFTPAGNRLTKSMCLTIARDEEQPHKIPFDFVGAALSVSGWTMLVLGILLGQTYGFWSAKIPFSIGTFSINPLGLSVVPFLIGLGILLIATLFSWQSTNEDTGKPGLFRVSLFRIQGLPSGFAVRFTQMAVTAAFLFTMPLMFQLTFKPCLIEVPPGWRSNLRTDEQMIQFHRCWQKGADS